MLSSVPDGLVRQKCDLRGHKQTYEDELSVSLTSRAGEYHKTGGANVRILGDGGMQ